MHICFLDGHYPNQDGTGGGGAGWYIKIIAKRLVERGCDITILKVTPNQSIENFIDDNGARVVHYRTSSVFLSYLSKIPVLKIFTRPLAYFIHGWKAYVTLLWCNSKIKIDIIEVVEGGNIWLTFYKKFKFVEHLHCSQYTIRKQCKQKIPLGHLIERIISRFSMNYADAVIAPSKAMIKIVEEEKGKPFRKKFIIPYGIERNETIYHKKDTEKTIFIFASRNDPLKGGSTLIKAIDKVNEKVKEKVEFRFFGFVPNNKSDLPDNIIFNEFLSRDRLLNEYGNCDVALLPSLFDNSPLFIYESMAAGLPVIATDIGGIPELVKHRETGYLFKKNDYIALARYIITMVENPKKRMIMGNQAKDFIKGYAYAPIIAKKKISIFQDIIGNKKMERRYNYY
jgi:glycosyltransferase involved in cell wall biosynthesis